LALTPGARLGVYDITAPIGEGGMGSVFRARDTKLDRNVAIKVLPEAFAQAPDRLARFQREAKTLASLNHPNIGAIYGLEDSGGISALVMELVEGEDLSQRIARGAIATDEALSIAKQIADALEAAHEQGIIHRDLKPANIKVRPDGTVKVLDFGLAKALGPSKLGPYDPVVGAELAPPDMSPTLSMHATQAGIILGTAAYMSPEQARGTTADKRADLWGFGVVLWEMLTGKRLFEGATVSDTLASVLKSEPDWTALAPMTHPAIRRLLRRCLEKDRRRRLSDAADARLEIEEALHTPSPDAAVPASFSSGVSRRRAIVVAGAALLAGAAIAALTLSAFVRRAPALQSWSGVMLGGPQVSISPRPSPDGHLLAFVGNDADDVLQLWVAKPESGNRIMLTHNRERGYVQSCSWSADGNRIYYDRWLDGPRGVFSVPALGGDEQMVVEDGMFPEPLPDGSLLLVRINPENRRQLFRYWPDSGKLQGYAVQPTSELSGPRSVRGGRLALVIGVATAPGADRGVYAWIVDLPSGELRRLPVDLSNVSNTSIAATWDGKRALIGSVFGSLYRVIGVPLDATASQRPTTLLTSTLSAWTIDAGPDDSIFVEQNDRPLELVRFDLGSSASGDRSGRAGGVHVDRIATLASSGLSTMQGDYFAVLPDGRALWTEVNGGRKRVMVVEAGKDPVPLVSTSEETFGPMTGVGAGEVAFMIGSKGNPAIGLAALANGRITRQFSFDKGFVSSMAASPDGKTIYAVANGLVWALSVTGEAPRKIRSGDGVTVDIATQSLVVFVQQPGNNRLIRIPLAGGPEQEIAGSFHLGGVVDPGAIRNGRMVSPLAGPYWYWPPGIFDLATGRSERIPLDYTEDFHHMAWTPDGKVMAVAVGFRGSIWKFTPEGK
jgi:serine/threonine protein kinase